MVIYENPPQKKTMLLNAIMIMIMNFKHVQTKNSNLDCAHD